MKKIIFAFLVCLLATVAFVACDDVAFAEGKSSYVLESHNTEFATKTRTENDAQALLLVSFDHEHSGINKDQSALFAGIDNVERVEDMTYVYGDINSKKYLNIDEFAQVYKVYLIDCSNESIESTMSQIAKIDGVIAVERNDTNIQLATNPPAMSGTRYPLQWGLHGGNGINAPDAWNYCIGSADVHVAVIDTGVVWHLDIDGNYIDGRDCANSNDYADDDTNGHGTHVAGIIGAAGNTTNGVLGVCRNVKIAPVQVIDDNGNIYPSYLVDAITWVNSNDIDIINISIEYSPEITAIKNVLANFNGLTVCAAGNGAKNIDENPIYPASYSNGQSFSDRVISVGAIKSSGEIPTEDDWGYKDGNPQGSNFGLHKVSIFAPGDGIWSTYPYGLGDLSGYFLMSGTSMAAPHVAGVAALLLAYCPNFTAAQIKTTIISNARYNANCDGKCVANGVVDAKKVLESHTHNFSYSYNTSSTHTAVCNSCGNTQTISHTITYQSISVTGGHIKHCDICNHNIGSALPHTWLPQYILGTPHGYKCKQCGLWTLYLDIPHPDLAPGIRDQLSRIEIDEDGIGVLLVSEHVAIIYDNGRYGLLVECDEQGKPLAEIPKEIFGTGFDVDVLQKELDKKAEDLLAIFEERKKTIEELFEE